MTILTGDCVELLATLPENSLDACVCDPPYDLTAGKKGGSGEKSLNLNSPAGRARISTGFMGLGWDGTGVAFSKTTWAAVYRVLKPGAHLLAFGGTRTYHRMTVAIEDAGFEIRDSIHWIYGTGFPKSLNVALKIDMAEGHPNAKPGQLKSAEAKKWEGWGTALKPAHEPIVLARKPFEVTVAENVQVHGTGAINIDATRISFESDSDQSLAKPQGRATSKAQGASALPDAGRGLARVDFDVTQSPLGRWPANVILSHSAACMLSEGPCAADCPVAELDRQSGVSRSPETYTRTVDSGNVNAYAPGIGEPAGQVSVNYGDAGGASRFFYVTKASRSERERGCEALPERTAGEVTGGRKEGSDGLNSPRAGAGRTSGARNFHPTVKPVALMQYLVRLVTPPGGTVLDPFMGSGTTGLACQAEGFEFIGMELSAEYVEIARARLGAA